MRISSVLTTTVLVLLLASCTGSPERSQGPAMRYSVQSVGSQALWQGTVGQFGSTKGTIDIADGHAVVVDSQVVSASVTLNMRTLKVIGPAEMDEGTRTDVVSLLMSPSVFDVATNTTMTITLEEGEGGDGMKVLMNGNPVSAPIEEMNVNLFDDQMEMIIVLALGPADLGIEPGSGKTLTTDFKMDLHITGMKQ